MDHADLLARAAALLKARIAPAVEGEFEKTQAYMLAVVLDKLSGELGNRQADGAARAEDLAALADALTDALPAGSEAALVAAVGEFTEQQDMASLNAVVEGLYRHRATLGETGFAALLDACRQCLRRDLERRLEYAR